MICSNKCYKFTGGYCRASWEGWKWPKKKSPNFDCLKKKKLPKKDCLKACSKFALYCLFVVINISSLQGDIDVLLGRVGAGFGGELFFWIWWRYFLEMEESLHGNIAMLEKVTGGYCRVRDTLQRNIAVLLGRVLDGFCRELFQVDADALPGGARLDDVIHEPSNSGRERVAELLHVLLLPGWHVAVPPVEDRHRSLGSHHSHLSTGPRIVSVPPEVLRRHHIIGPPICLPGYDGDLGDR